MTNNFQVEMFETIDGQHQINVIKNNFVYGYTGTAREVEIVLCQLYDHPEKAFKKLLKFAVIN